MPRSFVPGRAAAATARLVALGALTCSWAACGRRSDETAGGAAGVVVPGGGCPAGTALVPGLRACVDRWEAAVERGRAAARAGLVPASETSWVEADAACRAAGKRLCTEEEWDRACRGAGMRPFPYGAAFDPARCNGAARWDDPRRAAVVPAGSLEGCATPEGVFDLSGNVWEWTATTDATGTLRVLRGGGFANGKELLGCRPEEGGGVLVQPADEAHSGYGFRCCADPAP